MIVEQFSSFVNKTTDEMLGAKGLEQENLNDMFSSYPPLKADNLWNYRKNIIHIEERENYDSYNEFALKYVNPIIGTSQTYLLIINVYNNTNNTRAALYHIEYISESYKVVNVGKRIGGNFYDTYGADFYPNSVIEIYVANDVPKITIAATQETSKGILAISNPVDTFLDIVTEEVKNNE